LLGAGIGAAAPRWVLRYESPHLDADTEIQEELDGSLKLMPTRPFGAFDFQCGYAMSTWKDAPGGSAGGRMSLTPQIYRAIALGPEVGYYELGDATNFWHVGAVSRITKAYASVHFYCVADFGIYDWNRAGYGSELFIGYGLGIGARYLPGRGSLALVLEGRGHSNFTRAGYMQPLGFLTFVAGVQHAW